MKKFLLIIPAVILITTQCHHERPEVLVNQNNINALAIDKMGNKWFATPAGLYRYDNTSWLKYQIFSTDPEINSLKIQNDTILLSSHAGSVMVRIEGNTLANLNQYNTSTTSIISDTVNVAAFDPNNSIWFGTYLGIAFLNGTQLANNSDINYQLITKDENISCVAFRQNDYFFGTYGKSLWHITYDNQIDAVSGASRMIQTLNGDLTTDSIFSLFAGSDSSIWIGSSAGLTRNKGNTHVGYGEFEYFLEGQRIHSILESSDKRIWAGTESGLYVKEGSTWSKYTTAEGLVDNFILSLGEADGGIWIGTKNGVSLFKNATFTNFMLQ
jgi:ligand-binding sensor domain-containing protein